MKCSQPRGFLGRAAFLLALAASLLVACESGSPAPAKVTSVVRQDLSAETRRVTVSLPVGAAFTGVPVTAMNELRVSDRARVQFSNGTFAPVGNSGSTITELGADSRVGTTTSEAPVTMRDRAQVTGNLTSAGAITRGNNTIVTGTVSPNTPVIFDRWSWTVALPASGAAITVPVNGTRNLSSGSYASVVAFSGARLNLVAGTYFLDSLTMEPQSTLGADTRNGAITLYVRQGFTFRGTTTFTGPNDRLMIVYLGAASPALDRSFSGTLVAPNAFVRLGVGGSPYTGAVFAQSVLLDPDVRFTLRPFSGWNQITFDVEPRFDCVERRPNGAFVGHFGYRNPRGTNVSIPLGPNNRFVPGVENRQQPTLFKSGTWSKQFAVTWVTHEASWFVNGLEARVDHRRSCPSTVSFSAVADTSIKSSSPAANFGTSGTLTIGKNEHALVTFDRAAVARELGPNRIVQSARLELTVASLPTLPLEAIAMRNPWTEKGATWLCARDQDASATVDRCQAVDRWDPVRQELTIWENPWFQPNDTPSIGTVQGSTISFDVSSDAGRFLGTEGVGNAVSWVIQTTGGTGVTGSLRAREAGAAVAARLIIEPVGFTDYDVITGGDEHPPITFVVDPSVVPTDIPRPSPITGGPARPLAAVRAPDGLLAEFTDLELVLFADSPSEIAAVQARLGAQLTYSHPIVVPGLPQIHLLRIDPSRADPTALAPDLLARVPGLRGRQRVSSATGLATLAAASQEAMRGTLVAVNWITRPAAIGVNDFANQQIIDGLSVDGDSSNVFDWTHFGESMHNITGAWLDGFAAMTSAYPRVKVAIQDNGFAKDLMDGFNLNSPGCPTDNCSNSNPFGCGNTSCPWHGQEVLNAGFGEPGNGFGAAGPGHGVSALSLSVGFGDFFAMDAFLVDAMATGQDIANMSYAFEVPDWAVAITTVGTLGANLVWIEGVTATARGTNMLLFAGAGPTAGGNGQNVDAKRCYTVKEPVTDLSPVLSEVRRRYRSPSAPGRRVGGTRART